MWDGQCQLFTQLVDSDSVCAEDASHHAKGDDAEKPSNDTALVEPTKAVVDDQSDPCPYWYISDSPTSSSSLWNFIDDFYGCRDDADSLQQLPGVPNPERQPKMPKCESPSAAMSEGQASSSASNRTPVKKVD